MMGEEISREPVVKLAPEFKDFIWGGTRLKEMFNKSCELPEIAESWELSAHYKGESRISCGEYAGMTFSDYLKIMGDDALGSKCKKFEKFPILIKLIDAKEPLSIQVHPQDEYASKAEGEYGKNEMWYIIDAAPGAFIYYGLSKNVSKEEIRKRIENGTLIDILHKAYVKKGDTYYVKAGTIHAIGAGVVACEIQESSDSTYRIYDYGRKDRNGKLRPLHIDKAINVIDIPLNIIEAENEAVRTESMAGFTRLVSSRFFTTDLYKKDSESVIKVNASSFAAIVILKGEGKLRASDGAKDHTFIQGDTFFVNAGNREITVDGSSEFLVVRV